MPLQQGTRFGTYEIAGAIGAGGMGEVYRARDTKLNRDVAIKVLPELFASDAERVGRFEREAQSLAALNHPHIAQIYGVLEQPLGLVMEFVEGEDLALHIARGPMPLDQALTIARQIADALDTAHERGIVHRDLKPANVKIREDGAVKVLDFGLAKALLGPAADGSVAPDTAFANSPTFTSPARPYAESTQRGVILGTASYMAPEQAKGKAVDRRADIWALGVVLFEMLTGGPVYRGETVTETIAHVITQPPPWHALPSTTPDPIRKLLRRCLEKDPRRRFQSAGDVRIEIEEYLSAPAADPVPAATVVRPHPWWRRAAPWAVTLLVLGALAATWWRMQTSKTSTPSIRVDARVGSGEELVIDDNIDSALAVLSPDGKTLAYLAKGDQGRRVYLRRLDRLESTPLEGTEGAVAQFFSPDGRNLAFFAEGTLKRVPTAGGPALRVAPAADPRGGTWGPDDTIVFTPFTVAGLVKVPASGGTPVELTHLQEKERSHRWPSFLPGGKAVLFITQQHDGAYDDGTIEAVRVDTGERKVLVRGGTFPRYVASGHLVFTRGGTLFAVPFDAARLEVRGDPQPVLGAIASSGTGVGGGVGDGASQFSIADNGIAAYLPAGSSGVQSRLTIVDRTGKTLYAFPDRHEFRTPRFSPDGRRLAVQMNDGKSNQVYVVDPERGTLTRMTFEGNLSGFPIWSPDGERIAYFSDRGGKGLDLYLIRSDGSGEPERLTTNGITRVPASFSADGKVLLAMEEHPKTGMDLIAVSIADKKITTLLNTAAAEMLPDLSTDGKWVAYQSNESSASTADVFVRAYPGGGGKRQVSSGGGGVPRWTKGGRELVFISGIPARTSVKAVDVMPEGGALRLGKPQELFQTAVVLPPNAVPFDVSADGMRFAILAIDGEAAPKQTHVTLVLNFFDDIRRALSPNQQ